MIILLYFYTLLTFLNATLLDNCKKTPFWKLNLCEIDCDKCGANGLCEQCPEGFNLTKTKCEQDKEFIYQNTFFTQTQLNSTAINQNYFKVSNQYLKLSNVVRLCKSSSYKFDMVGLFKQQDRITYNMNFDTPVTQIRIRFNFVTLYRNTKLQVVLNGDQVFQQVFKGSNIDYTYEASQDSINYLSLPSLTETSSSVLINKVVVGPIGLSESQFKSNLVLQLEVTYTDNATNTTSFWGFSDFSVVGKKCQTCIPQKLKTLSKNVGIALGINAGALLVLILILYGCVKLQERRRRTSFQEKSNYQSFNQESDKEEQKEEGKQYDLKIRQTIKQPKQISTDNKKNKNV